MDQPMILLMCGRPVQKGQVLLTVVEPQGDWELDCRCPRTIWATSPMPRPSWALSWTSITSHGGPGTTLQGKVKEVHESAEVRGEEGNTVLIRVAINKDDVPLAAMPPKCTARPVHCGRAAIGYVWFHDLVTFVQKTLFRFL